MFVCFRKSVVADFKGFVLNRTAAVPYVDLPMRVSALNFPELSHLLYLFSAAAESSVR